MRFECSGDDVRRVDRLALDPEGLVQDFEGAGQFSRVEGLDGAEGAAGVDGWLREGLGARGGDGDGEVTGPALAFEGDPFVFVFGWRVVLAWCIWWSWRGWRAYF